MSIQRLSNAGQSGYRYKTLIAGITPVASVPTIGTATALTYSTASVEFTAPGAYAGSTYTATSSPGGFTGTSASSPITVSGLSGETSYTFTVTATNATGTSGPSAASNSITTPAEWSPESGYDALATVTVPSGGLASITFAGIPSTYKHLQIRYSGHLVGNANDYASLWMQFNSDTSANYSYHRLYGNGSSASADAATSQTRALTTWIPDNLTQSLSYGASVIDILDYTNTNKYKTVRDLGGFDLNGSGIVALFSGLWMSTSAITSISLVSSQSQNFAQYSSFALYGVK